MERLLAGPDDAELSPRSLALLRTHLNQPVFLAQIQREARSEGRSETAQRRNKLKLIYNFNRYLWAESPAAIESEPADPSTKPSETEPTPVAGDVLEGVLAFQVSSVSALKDV